MNAFLRTQQNIKKLINHYQQLLQLQYDKIDEIGILAKLDSMRIADIERKRISQIQ